MPEYRYDAFSDRWVIIAPDRWQRPDQLQAAAAPRRIVAPCPFCAGHESETPHELAVYPSAGDGSAWQVRVVPNKYPAVCLASGQAAGEHGPGSAAPGLGTHEVIIESPLHVVSFTQLTDGQAEMTFLAYRDRMRAARQDSRLAYAMVFKNARAAGGASLEHSHSQFIATAGIPESVQKELAQAGQYLSRKRTCIYCDLLARELQEGARLVTATSGFAAVVPFASRFPYEIWILPRRHQERFEETQPGHLRELAHLVRDSITRLESLLEQPAYNYWIHTAPLQRFAQEGYHWHLELIPRLTRLAGFELGAGYFINPVSPEEAARCLRTAGSDVGSSGWASGSDQKG